MYPEDVDLQQPSSPAERIGGPAGQLSKTSKVGTKGRRGRPVRGRRSKQPGIDRSTPKAERGHSPVDFSTLETTDNGKEVELKDNTTPAEEAPKVCEWI